MVSTANCFNQGSSTNSNWVQLNQNAYVLANGHGTNNQTVNYVQAPPPQACPGYYYSQNQGGMKQLAVGSVGSGMGQAIGQEMVHSAISGWGNGSGSSGKDDSGILSSWVGDGANIL